MRDRRRKYNCISCLLYTSTFISKDGERTFGTYLGAAALLDAEELKIADFEGYKYFYIEGYLVQSHALIRRAIELAREAGAKVVLDLAKMCIRDRTIVLFCLRI